MRDYQMSACAIGLNNEDNIAVREALAKMNIRIVKGDYHSVTQILNHRDFDNIIVGVYSPEQLRRLTTVGNLIETNHHLSTVHIVTPYEPEDREWGIISCYSPFSVHKTPVDPNDLREGLCDIVANEIPDLRADPVGDLAGGLQIIAEVLMVPLTFLTKYYLPKAQWVIPNAAGPIYFGTIP